MWLAGLWGWKILQCSQPLHSQMMILCKSKSWECWYLGTLIRISTYDLMRFFVTGQKWTRNQDHNSDKNRNFSQNVRMKICLSEAILMFSARKIHNLNCWRNFKYSWIFIVKILFLFIWKHEEGMWISPFWLSSTSCFNSKTKISVFG